MPAFHVVHRVCDGGEESEPTAVSHEEDNGPKRNLRKVPPPLSRPSSLAFAGSRRIGRDLEGQLVQPPCTMQEIHNKFPCTPKVTPLTPAQKMEGRPLSGILG